MEDDRISQLPIPILHNILCFISQKETVRTCLLSKRWRHIGLTRPNLEFFEEWFDDKEEKFVHEGSTLPNLNSSSENLFNSTQEKFVPVVDRTLQRCRDQKRSILHRILSILLCKGSTRHILDSPEILFNTTQQNFVSVVNRTLQGYLDQNLSIHKLHLDLYSLDSQPVISLLDKWIPIISALNIKAFELEFLSHTPAYYHLPSAVFLAESLEELHLCKCRLSPVESVRFKSLRKLTLEQVQVDGGTFDTKMLGCPLLRCLVLYSCWELRNVRVSEEASPGLKHFVLWNFMGIEGRSIKIDVPNIETISIHGQWIWCHCQSAFLFSRLTSLDLDSVILSSESFDLFSFGCPTLANLTLDNCSGFEEFHLASDSVKWLSIKTHKIPLKGVTICAPNIINFMFSGRIPQVPDTFSFATPTSKHWYSGVFLSSCDQYDPNFDANSWFLELRRLLKALSGSKISLKMDGGPRDVPCSAVLGDEPPVVVWSLNFDACKCRTVSWYLEFTNGLFRVFRPSHVWGGKLVSESDRKYYRFSEFQLNILLANKKVELEGIHVDGQLVQWTDLSELRNRMYDKEIWLELKWRGGI
ncbi:F-box/FBD/LRR-repeat protein [Striga hermonthica]|uniref:F-box/FBD/LRR-repeat protein n=1 Tax=Striga hermonthica TaxID=68872 RepID=A0A9N7NSK0_STRHE|nr:F-box/FBD/LRR-repeat protein [Striga hermonthica]